MNKDTQMAGQHGAPEG